MDKKTTQITIHCAADMRVALQSIAEKRGKTESELGREIIGKFLKSQFDELSVLNKYFKANSSVGSNSDDMFADRIGGTE